MALMAETAPQGLLDFGGSCLTKVSVNTSQASVILVDDVSDLLRFSRPWQLVASQRYGWRVPVKVPTVGVRTRSLHTMVNRGRIERSF